MFIKRYFSFRLYYREGSREKILVFSIELRHRLCRGRFNSYVEAFIIEKGKFLSIICGNVDTNYTT